MFHLGFSISMSIRSLGCQSQLRGHYWQYRDARVCLTVSDSVCQSEANFSFVWPVRRGRLVVWRSLLCFWSVLCLPCQYCGLWCAAAFPRAVELTNDCVSKDCRFMPPQIRTSSYQSGFQFRWCITTGRTCINPYRRSAQNLYKDWRSASFQSTVWVSIRHIIWIGRVLPVVLDNLSNYFCLLSPQKFPWDGILEDQKKDGKLKINKNVKFMFREKRLIWIFKCMLYIRQIGCWPLRVGNLDSVSIRNVGSPT